jgi:hypothetical protein
VQQPVSSEHVRGVALGRPTIVPYSRTRVRINGRWAAVRVEAAALERTHAVIEALRAAGHLELITMLAMESATGSSPEAHARCAAAVDDLVRRS